MSSADFFSSKLNYKKSGEELRYWGWGVKVSQYLGYIRYSWKAWGEEINKASLIGNIFRKGTTLRRNVAFTNLSNIQLLIIRGRKVMYMEFWH